MEPATAGVAGWCCSCCGCCAVAGVADAAAAGASPGCCCSTDGVLRDRSSRVSRPVMPCLRCCCSSPPGVLAACGGAWLTMTTTPCSIIDCGRGGCKHGSVPWAPAADAASTHWRHALHQHSLAACTAPAHTGGMHCTSTHWRHALHQHTLVACTAPAHTVWRHALHQHTLAACTAPARKSTQEHTRASGRHQRATEGPC